MNTKIKAGLLSLVFGMVSVAYAQSVEELDREIAKLKKENELLELKAKNENLRSGNEVSSAGGGSTSGADKWFKPKKEKELTDKQKMALNTAPKKEGFLKGKCKGKYVYTGCFIGVELGLSFNNNVWVNGGGIDDYSSAPNINVEFGWQWYYWANAGLRIKGFAGFSYYGAENMVKISLPTLQYGLAVAWHPYNFIYGGKHTLGLHIEEGLELSTIIGSVTTQNGGDSNNGGNSTISGTGTQVASTTAFGVHYFYKNKHQFALDYKIRFYNLEKVIHYNGSHYVWAKPSNALYLSYAYMF